MSEIPEDSVIGTLDWENDDDARIWIMGASNWKSAVEWYKSFHANPIETDPDE